MLTNTHARHTTQATTSRAGGTRAADTGPRGICPFSGRGSDLHHRLVVFSVWAPHFLTAQSLASAVQVAAELGIVAIAVTLLMIAGEYDLSVRSIIGLAALVGGGGAAGPFAAAGHACPRFRAATVVVIDGVLMAFTHHPVADRDPGGHVSYSTVVYVATQGFAISVTVSGVTQALFDGGFHGFAVSVIWWVALTVDPRPRAVAHGSSATTSSPPAATSRAARRLRGTGPAESRSACTSCTPRSRPALVGVIQLVRFSSADPTLGQNVELTAIAAAVIGGTRLQGGSGTVLGTAFGCLTLGFIEVGLQLASVPTYFFQGLVGLILLAAVLVNLYLRGGQVQR